MSPLSEEVIKLRGELSVLREAQREVSFMVIIPPSFLKDSSSSIPLYSPPSLPPLTPFILLTQDNFAEHAKLQRKINQKESQLHTLGELPDHAGYSCSVCVLITITV